MKPNILVVVDKGLAWNAFTSVPCNIYVQNVDRGIFHILGSVINKEEIKKAKLLATYVDPLLLSLIIKKEGKAK